MEDVELFVHMAEIAGVFVGFGALIAIRSGSAVTTGEISNLRWMISTAIWVVIAALAPIIVSRYEVTGPDLWLPSSLLALVVFVLMLLVNARAPENVAELSATLSSTPRRVLVLVYVPLMWVPTIAIVVALGLVAFGAVAGHEQAVYLTAVGVGLLLSAIVLFTAVFERPRPATTTER